MNIVLSIGGFDPTAGAGVLRDVLTFRKIGVYGFAVITAVTFQNLSGFYGFHALRGEDVKRQIENIMVENKVRYVKVSMVGNGEISRILEEKIGGYGWYVVFDPLLYAKNGYPLNRMEDIERIMRISNVIVPNVPEAEILSGMKIENSEDVVEAGWKIREKYGAKVIIKGGHLEGEDYLFGEKLVRMKMKHLGKIVHGTGCVYSSALLGYLAHGYSLEKAFKRAREFLQGEIEKSLKLGGEYEVLS